MNDRTSM